MVMVLAEHRRGELRDVSFELLTKADELATAGDSTVSVVLLTDERDGLVDPLRPWADEVLVAEDPVFADLSGDAIRQGLGHLIESREPGTVLVGHTSQGLEFAPRLAAQLEHPLVTKVEQCRWRDGEFVAERSVYDDQFGAEVGLRTDGPPVVTVQAATFPAGEPPGRGGSVVEVDLPVDSGEMASSFIEYLEPETGAVDIAEADVLVSVGRGIEEEDNLDIVEDLAAALDAEIAGSRPLIDNGWLPSDRQVGQSGKTVTPDLYLAIGISGASQHLMGMKGSDTVVAINNDPNAPIFDIADYGIVDDLFDVVPALTDRLTQEISTQP